MSEKPPRNIADIAVGTTYVVDYDNRAWPLTEALEGGHMHGQAFYWGECNIDNDSDGQRPQTRRLSHAEKMALKDNVQVPNTEPFDSSDWK